MFYNNYYKYYYFIIIIIIIIRSYDQDPTSWLCWLVSEESALKEAGNFGLARRSNLGRNSLVRQRGLSMQLNIFYSDHKIGDETRIKKIQYTMSQLKRTLKFGSKKCRELSLD